MTMQRFSAVLLTLTGATSDTNGSLYNVQVNEAYANGDVAPDFSIEYQVTAISGTTPSCTLSVEGSSEATVSAYKQVDQASAFTAVGATRRNPTVPLPAKLRAKAVITGTTPVVTGQVLLTANVPFTLVATT